MLGDGHAGEHAGEHGLLLPSSRYLCSRFGHPRMLSGAKK
jgi:hypothetical protein